MGRTGEPRLSTKKGRKKNKTPYKLSAQKRVAYNLEAQEEPEVSTSELDMSQLTIDTSFDSQEPADSSITSTTSMRETKGQPGEIFIERRLDFRSFGRATYTDWVNSGAVARWVEMFALFEKAGTAERAEKVMVNSTELPLSYRGRRGVNYIAYGEGKDVVNADSWIRKHRAHRGFAQKMDARLERLYFPLGRGEGDAEEEEPIAAEQREERAEDPAAWEEQEDEWDAVVDWFVEPDSTFRL
jgi:hypothetical protein